MKKSLIAVTLSLTSFFIFTSFASAAVDSVTGVAQGIGTLSGLIDGFTQTVVKSLGQLALAGGVVAFFYGVVRYIWGVREAKPDVIATGNKFMGYGLLALFVMFSVYGIIKFGQGILFGGIDVNKITIPEIDFGRKSTGGKTNTGDPLIKAGASSGGKTNSGDPLVKPVTGSTGNSAFDTCIANGGGVSECRAMTKTTPINSDASNAVQSGGAGGTSAANCTNAKKGDMCNAGNNLTGTCQDMGSGSLECSSE